MRGRTAAVQLINESAGSVPQRFVMIGEGTIYYYYFEAFWILLRLLKDPQCYELHYHWAYAIASQQAVHIPNKTRILSYL